MSTRGSFIVRKGGNEKELYISSGAYPDWAGACVISLVKKENIENLFDLMDQEISDEEEYGDFNPEKLIRAIRKNTPYPTHEKVNDVSFIKDSLYCEYAYVLDLNSNALEFYRGFQTSPQADNPYGSAAYDREYSSQAYYPCRLVAVFSFDYIRQMNKNIILKDMKAAAENMPENIMRYDVAANTPNTTHPNNTDDIIENIGQILENISVMTVLLDNAKKGVVTGIDLTGAKERIRPVISELIRKLQEMEAHL